jgi:asparagine synthase (glutamine-hydrolysing)
VTVVGTCLARDHEIRRCMALSGTRRWHQLAMLPGSFWVIARDREDTVVFCADVASRPSVFYAPVDGGVVWATAETPVREYFGDGPDPEAVLLDMLVSEVPMFGGEVPRQGTRATGVRPGWLLRISGREHSVERWYSRREHVTYEGAAPAFREWLLDWIDRWAHHGNGAVVSADFGGLDSSAAAVLAARVRRVLAITQVVGRDRQELELVRRISRAAGGVEHRLLQSDETLLPYGGLADLSSLPDTDAPSASVVLLDAGRATFRLAAEAGSSDHLTGWSGDLVLSPRPAALAGLVRSGHAVQALRATLALARGERSSAARACVELLRLTASTYEDAGRRMMRTMHSFHSRPPPDHAIPSWQRELDWASMTEAVHWLTDEAASGAVRRLEQLIAEPPEFTDPERAFDWWEARRGADATAAISAIARNEGIQPLSPYRDTRIVDLCLALAGPLREPAGTFKRLVTEELGDLLPAALAARRSKDNLVVDDDAQAGMRRHAAVLRELIASDSSALVRAGLVDRRRVNDALGAMLTGRRGLFPAVDRLIAISVWLTKPRQTWWEANTCTPQPTT